jgi:S-(hydroxymethyl)glutathione dehydrogenase/alcohol dehydrogenase
VKAAVLVSLNKPLDIALDVELPVLRRGQVLVKLAYSGVCHSQIMEARGRRGDDPWLPHLLGHEGSGRVIQIGEGVTKVAPGDMVILGWIKGDGIEAGGAQYQRAGKTVNAGGVTTFNEYAVVSENRVVMLPEGVPLDVAVLFGCAIPTGAGIVLNELQPRENASFAVFGLGGIGLSALMATQLFTPKTVIAIDINEEKLALARDFGATHTINSRNEDALAEILRIVPGGVDYSVDASGHTNVIETAFKAVRRNGGLCVFASHPEQGAQIKIDPYELICGKQIRGSWGGAVRPDRDIPRFAKLYTDGKLPLQRLISKSYSLDQINAALDDLEGGYVGRPLIKIDPTI